MTTPLLSGWTIAGDSLPERLQPHAPAAPAFRLPGADALAAFADLIGSDAPEEPAKSSHEGAPFPLPALMEADTPGCVTLRREISFASLAADRAQIHFDMLCGCGDATLTSLPPRFPRKGMPEPEPITLRAAFANGPLTLDVTEALQSGRRFALTLQFTAERPAGVCGAIALRTAAHAQISRLTPEPAADGCTVTLHTVIAAARTGDYLLHAQACPAEAPQEALPVYERPLQFAAGETRTVRLNLNIPTAPFTPGQTYASAAVKVWLFRKTGEGKPLQLCDSLAMPVGFPGPVPRAFLPLTAQDCRRPPQQLCGDLLALHIPAVSLCAPAPDLFYRTLTRSGVSALHPADLPAEDWLAICHHACTVFGGAWAATLRETADPLLSAWQLCGLLSCPRQPEPGLPPALLLAEIAGRTLDPASPAVQDVLAWLRAFSVRLRAEAIRQQAGGGMLCAPGEWQQGDIADALRTALAPLHISALPLCGAWWAGSHFSASLRAFIPEGQFPANTLLRAEATLEDAQGVILARHIGPCPSGGGSLGVLSALLPEEPCALELICRLYAGEDVVEESTQPVYVGVRGALEAAFAACGEDDLC